MNLTVFSLCLKQSSMKNKVFAVYVFFTQHKDEEICQKAITGLGEEYALWEVFGCGLSDGHFIHPSPNF